jgi:hypothetical protein
MLCLCMLTVGLELLDLDLPVGLQKLHVFGVVLLRNRMFMHSCMHRRQRRAKQAAGDFCVGCMCDICTDGKTG